MSADVRAKALAYLRDERVRVVSAGTPEGHLRPYRVTAYVNGHTGRHRVEFEAGAWSCTCGRLACPHAAAVQLVTGWTGPASKGGA